MFIQILQIFNNKINKKQKINKGLKTVRYHSIKCRYDSTRASNENIDRTHLRLGKSTTNERMLK